ncbi:phage tail protein [Oscillatoria sp. CS-180]|uniref:phage tail protein n=1 Tax=Oscillatoria sp. CS-180 TaxID=3021720 RepID=UPI00232EC3E4|nr:phage tail protein [Oscillatoria sp. CS-180]MDB9526520.1 phage tail protein [Oscillatoria sp. CS-180]
MTQGPQFNYVTANRFYVEIDSEIAASFSECAGLGITLQVQPLVEGGVNDQQRFLLDAPKFSNVTLKRGVTDSLDFWNWLQKILDNETNQRRNVSILLFSQAGETMQCWTLIGAVPIGWKADALQARSEAVALEELTLAYEGLKIEGNNSGSGFAQQSQGRDTSSGYFAGKS